MEKDKGRKTMKQNFAILAVTALLLCSLTACGGGEQQEMGETRTVYTMDTVMNLTAYGESASAALDAAEETLRTLDAKLDRHDETSTVSALNRDGTVEDAELAQLTDIARTIGELSGGAFDPTVAPVMDAWDFTGDAPRVPSDEELSALLAHVGLEKLSVDGNTVTLSDGAQLDLGGIAKGYEVDKAAEAALQAGIRRGVIDLGGNLRLLPEPPPGKPFYRVGIRNPKNRDELLPEPLELRNAPVSTSGDYERYVTIGKHRYGQIMKLKTGLPTQSD